MNFGTRRHLPGNPYDTSGFESGPESQAVATVMLAYEQRTATLVSLLADPGVPDGIKNDVRRQVLSRLGFDAATESKPQVKPDANKMF